MIRKIIAIAAMLLTGASANATPPPAPPDHDPEMAHCALVALVAELSRRDEEAPLRIKVVTDSVGTVRPATRDQFYDELMGKHGGPLEILDWGVVQPSYKTPIYFMSLGNDKRLVGRLVPSNEPIYAHEHRSLWFVTFGSDSIYNMISAKDLDSLIMDATKTPTCADPVGASN